MELWSKELLIKSSPYKKGEVLFESATAGTYSVDLAVSGKYEVYVIGGGSGGATRVSSSRVYLTGGGSGSGFIGVVKLTKGSHSITVGAGGDSMYTQATGTTTKAGGDSCISDLITAYGGKATSIGSDGIGGDVPNITVSVISTTLNVAGNNGSSDSSSDDSTEYITIAGGESVYNGYGAGGTTGSGSPRKGTAGYIKIIYIGG